jgi:hypothetical protein
MITAEVYGASPIRRSRRTKSDMASIRAAILDVIKVERPMRWRCCGEAQA